MKAKLKLFIAITSSILVLGPFKSHGQNTVGIGTKTPNSNAVLDLVSPNNNQGFMAPRLTTAQRTSPGFISILSSADNGLMVFDSSLKSFFYWKDNQWIEIGSGTGGVGQKGEKGDKGDPGDKGEPGIAYAAGTGIQINGTIISNTAPDKVVNLTGAGSTTVTGAYPNFTISSFGSSNYTAGQGIQINGNVINNGSPDQVVSLTGTGATAVTGAYPNFTIHSTDNNTQYSSGEGIAIDGSVIKNTLPDKTVTLSGSGATSVSGTYPNFTVHSTDNNTQYSSGEGIAIDGTVIKNTLPDKTVTLSGSGATSVSGSYPNFTIHSTDLGKEYIAGDGITIDGNVIKNTSPNQQITLRGSGSTTISGSYPDYTISSTDLNTTYTAGTGISISGNQVSASLDNLTLGLTNSKAIEVRDESITTSKIQNGAITAVKISSGGVADGNKVLSTDNNGTPRWESKSLLNIPALPSGQIFMGNALNIATPVFLTGDASLSSLGILTIGDSKITSSKIADNAITDSKIASVSPTKLSQNGATTGQALKWNGTSWTPQADNSSDADADPSNELQDLNINSSHQLKITKNTSATVIDLSPYLDNTDNQVISFDQATGRLTISNQTAPVQLSANGDVTGNINSTIVSKIQGRAVNAANPNTGDVLKWNGSQWAPAEITVPATTNGKYVNGGLNWGAQPTNPSEGMLWLDISNDKKPVLKVYTSGSWVQVIELKGKD